MDVATRSPVIRVENSFELSVQGPFARVVPLFGAWEERAWAGEDWTPAFLYPQPARDEQGEVFTLEQIAQLERIYDLTLRAADSHQLKEKKR